MVSDGNQKLTRKLKTTERRTVSRVWELRKKKLARTLNKRHSFHCKAANGVHGEEIPDPKRPRTSGVFATVDMRTEEIITLSEMLNKCMIFL